MTASANVKNPQTFNRYSYVLNSPYKFTDPLGLISSDTGARGGAWCSTCDSHDGPGGFAEEDWAGPANSGPTQDSTTNDANAVHAGTAPNSSSTQPAAQPSAAPPPPSAEQNAESGPIDAMSSLSSSTKPKVKISAQVVYITPNGDVLKTDDPEAAAKKSAKPFLRVVIKLSDTKDEKYLKDPDYKLYFVAYFLGEKFEQLVEKGLDYDADKRELTLTREIVVDLEDPEEQGKAIGFRFELQKSEATTETTFFVTFKGGKPKAVDIQTRQTAVKLGPDSN